MKKNINKSSSDKQSHRKTVVKRQKEYPLSNNKQMKKRKSKWFIIQQSRTKTKDSSSSVKVQDSGKEVNKSSFKTIAMCSTTNPSSNWKNLLKVGIINSKRESNMVKTDHKEKANFKTKRKRTSALTKKQSIPECGPKIEGKKPDVWFDDVDEELLELNRTFETAPIDTQQKPNHSRTDNTLTKPGAFAGCTKTVAMDCEMVGVGEGGKENELARVSIVNRLGHCLYDKFVKPREDVVDYRTHVSGVRACDLENAEEFSTVQKDVYNIIRGRILVGHAIHNDLKVLYLSHPKGKIRDTSRYKPFRQIFNGRIPSLKKLSEKLLGVEVQTGEHNSIQDAQAAMRLYTMHRNVWEKELKSKRITKKTEAKSSQESRS